MRKLKKVKIGYSVKQFRFSRRKLGHFTWKNEKKLHPGTKTTTIQKPKVTVSENLAFNVLKHVF